MYRIKKQHIYLEILGLLAFLLLIVFYHNVAIQLASLVFVVFFARDIRRMTGTTYELSKEGIKVKVRGELREDRLWKDMDFITRSRKNTRIVALVFDKDVVTLPPYVEGFEDMVRDVFDYNKTNKHVAVHESIPGAFDLDIKLKDNGKIKVK